MEIFLNGTPHPLEQNHTILALLEQLGINEKRLAVEVNLHIIPRSQFSNYLLAAGDKVEIVHAIGGG